jgi:hypothetical protein
MKNAKHELYNLFNPSDVSMDTSNSVNNSEDSSPHTGNTHQQQSSDKSVKQESKHSTSPSLNSDLSINDNEKNVKILKLFLVFWFISKNEKYTKNSYCSHC